MKPIVCRAIINCKHSPLCWSLAVMAVVDLIALIIDVKQSSLKATIARNSRQLFKYKKRFFIQSMLPKNN